MATSASTATKRSRSRGPGEQRVSEGEEPMGPSP